MTRSRYLIVPLSLAAALLPGLGRAGDEVRNWFDDPFFRIAAALPDCPAPLGPMTTEADMRRQSHHRAEKGTSCWLAGQCDRPSAYAYDRDIAAALRTELQKRGPVADSSLWVTVQGRVVYLEGCARSESTGAELTALARSLPDVQQVVTTIRVGSQSPVPYRRARP